MTKEDEKSRKENNSEISVEQNLEDISKINTTEEELEAFMIVKTILRQKISVNRVTYRDAQSYFAIFLDDNNRKPICRLYLNGNKRFIGLLDENKKETKAEIQSIDELFNFSTNLFNILDFYESK